MQLIKPSIKRKSKNMSDTNKPDFLIALAAINGLMGVLMAATSAHWLPADIDAKSLGFFRQAAEMQLFHALAIFGSGIYYRVSGKIWSKRAGILFVIGIVCFSFSLYWRVFMGPGSLGTLHWITPVGGLGFMVGWAMLVFAAFKKD